MPGLVCPDMSGSSSSGGSSGGGSGGSSGSSSGGVMCGFCTSDLYCQETCPAVQGGGTNCCDPNSNICYATTQLTCPVPQDASTE